MKITDIRIRLIQNEESTLKGFASITIDECFVVHDIKILQKDNDKYIKMPYRVTPAGKKDDIAHPLNTETRNEITKLILDKYEEVLKEQA